jgi:hypothetical protein
MDSIDLYQYRSYLLRIWRVRVEDETWRASLERIGSGERRSFASLQALFEYLVETTHNLTGAEERSVDGQNHEIEP